MRLDKYLKAAKLFKRRTVSNAIAKQKKIEVNGRIAKPAQLIKIGDLITIRFANRLLTVKVLSLNHQRGSDAELMYEVVEAAYEEDNYVIPDK